MGAMKVGRKVSAGATTSENVGMSNFMEVKTLHTEHPRFPIHWQSGSG